MRNAYKILVWKLLEERPFERPRHMWEDNGKIGLRLVDLREIGFGVWMDSTDMV